MDEHFTVNTKTSQSKELTSFLCSAVSGRFVFLYWQSLTCCGLRLFLAINLLGIPFSVCFFLIIHHLLSHMLFSLSPSLFPCILSLLLKSLVVQWFSKRSERAVLLSYRRWAAGWIYFTTCPLSSVSTSLVSLYSPLAPSTPQPHASCTLFPPADTYTPKCKSYRANTMVLLSTYAQADFWFDIVEHPLSDKHQRDKPRGPTDKIPPFPYTSEGCRVFLAQPQTTGGCLVERKSYVLERESIQVWVQAESEKKWPICHRPKAFKMKNLPFKWSTSIHSG